MTKNLENADLIAKLVLATCTIVLFFTDVIAGPLAKSLVILSGIIITVFIVKALIIRRKPRRY